MKRWFFLRASTLGCRDGHAVLTSCSTPQTRISEHPDLYQSLSHRDQALVNQGQIRIGMSRTAVWLAWGSPDRKIVGNMGGGPTETWVYTYYATTRIIRHMNRWTNISGRLSTIRFVIRGSRQVFLILASSLLSPTAKSVSFQYVTSH